MMGVNREMVHDDVQRTLQTVSPMFRSWRIQELPSTESCPTEGWSRINVRPIDHGGAKLDYLCPHCANQWMSDRHCFILFKLNRRKQQLKIGIFGQQCLRCQSPYYVKPIHNPMGLHDTIAHFLERMNNQRTIIGNGSRAYRGRHTEVEVNRACEACSVDLCRSSIQE